MARQAGFSLIELMITVAVIGILAAVAYPSYQEHIRKSRRAEAQSVLMNLATRQQQALLDTRAYASAVSALAVSIPAGVGNFYSFTASAPAAVPPTFTLTATPQGDQTRDTCGTLSLNQAGVKSPARCW